MKCIQRHQSFHAFRIDAVRINYSTVGEITLLNFIHTESELPLLYLNCIFIHPVHVEGFSSYIFFALGANNDTVDGN